LSTGVLVNTRILMSHQPANIDSALMFIVDDYLLTKKSRFSLMWLD
jgi:hypothetical protein